MYPIKCHKTNSKCIVSMQKTTKNYTEITIICLQRDECVIFPRMNVLHICIPETFDRLLCFELISYMGGVLSLIWDRIKFALCSQGCTFQLSVNLIYTLRRYHAICIYMWKWYRDWGDAITRIATSVFACWLY